jgi:hypothetical protein
MKALTPYTFRTGAIVSDDLVNGNLRRSADDVNRNLEKRYTYCPPIVVPLDGITDVMTAAQRTIRFDRPTANNPVEIVRVELYVYSAAAVVWTLSQATTTWSSITLTTAGATTEAYAVSTTPIAVPNGGVDFVLSGASASTLTRAWLVIHCRADRGVQGASPNHAGYSPTFVDSSSSTAGSVLDTQLTALATAVTNDATNDKDLRCACFVARSFSTSQTWNLPSGAGMTGLAWRGYIVATIADAVTTGGSLSAATLTGTNTTNIVAATGTVTSTSDDPLTTASDFTATLTGVAGTVELAYFFVWWS